MKLTLLDYVSSKGYTIEQSERIIRAGQVMVNQMVIFTPSEKLDGTELVNIHKSKKYVSRGAKKLLNAIKAYDLNFNNKVILDIGSSTGGFTQVAIESGASHVYALDIGTNQLDYSLRSNNKVTTLEKTNLKTITNEMFDKNIEFVVVDVSFISLKEVFKVTEQLRNVEQMMVLIKPQFEANSDQVQNGGYVAEDLHPEIIEKVRDYADKYNWKIKTVMQSGVLGKQAKNIEYIADVRRK